MKKMKAVCAKGDGTVEVVEVPAPDITDDYECLVRVTACGLCSSTDLKIIGYGSVGEMPIEYPTLVGHEGVGVIEKVGSKVKSGACRHQPKAWVKRPSLRASTVAASPRG